MKKLSIILLLFFYGTTDGSILITNESKTEIFFNDKKTGKEKFKLKKNVVKKIRKRMFQRKIKILVKKIKKLQIKKNVLKHQKKKI